MTLAQSLTLAQWIVIAVALQRLAELAYSARNAKRLLAEGGVEHGVKHYPALILVHVVWLIALFFMIPADAPVYWPLLGLYALLQVARYWVIGSLGRYWTTRVITVPGAPMVSRGPYQFIRHPNYVVLACEVAVLPLAFGAWELAIAFSGVNGIILWERIKVEDAALAERRS